MPPDPLSAVTLLLQPLVFLGDGVYGVSRRQGTDAELVSALGVRHPLRRLASPRVWREHSCRTHQQEFAQAVVSEMTRCRSASNDPHRLLEYFLLLLVPRFESRDWGADFKDPDASETFPVPLPDISLRARSIPAPNPPGPGLVVQDRVWRLDRTEAAAGVHVRVGVEVLAPTGETVPLRGVCDQWRAAFLRLVQNTARTSARRSGRHDMTNVAAAHEELSRTGAVQRGKLVVLAANPPRIGHVMPRHFNRSLNRHVGDDTLLTAAFSVPPRSNGLSDLLVFARTRGGTWEPVSLPRSICLGTGAPNQLAGMDPGLVVLRNLRWAATRIATNERFHEHD